VVAGGRRRPCVAWPRRPMHMGPAPGPLSLSFFSFLLFAPPSTWKTLLGRPTFSNSRGPDVPAHFGF
jgi:hypothetical protein